MINPQIHLLQLTLSAFGDIDAVTWFAIFDIELSNHNVTLDEAKFGQLISRLPRKVLHLNKDLILLTDFKTRYKIANFIILTFQQSSKRTHLNKLLHTLQLVDFKPLALLRVMQDLTRSGFDAIAIRKNWMQRLPFFVRDILAS